MVRLRAFTLLELVLAMLLLSIVVALAYGILGGLSHTADRWSRADVLMEELRTTHAVITHDLDRSERVDNEDGLLVLSSNGQRTISYALVEDALLRQRDGVVDTLLHHVVGFVHKWHGTPTSHGPVDALQLVLSGERGDHTLLLRKHYDSATLYKIRTADAHPGSFAHAP